MQNWAQKCQRKLSSCLTRGHWWFFSNACREKGNDKTPELWLLQKGTNQGWVSQGILLALLKCLPPPTQSSGLCPTGSKIHLWVCHFWIWVHAHVFFIEQHVFFIEQQKPSSIRPLAHPVQLLLLAMAGQKYSGSIWVQYKSRVCHMLPSVCYSKIHWSCAWFNLANMANHRFHLKEEVESMGLHNKVKKIFLNLPPPTSLVGSIHPDTFSPPVCSKTMQQLPPP